MILFKFIASISYFIQESTTKVDANAYKNTIDELSKVSTILSIAVITILILLTISVFKMNKLTRENHKLKKALNK